MAVVAVESDQRSGAGYREIVPAENSVVEFQRLDNRMIAARAAVVVLNRPRAGNGLLKRVAQTAGLRRAYELLDGKNDRFPVVKRERFSGDCLVRTKHFELAHP